MAQWTHTSEKREHVVSAGKIHTHSASCSSVGMLPTHPACLSAVQFGQMLPVPTLCGEANEKSGQFCPSWPSVHLNSKIAIERRTITFLPQSDPLIMRTNAFMQLTQTSGDSNHLGKNNHLTVKSHCFTIINGKEPFFIYSIRTAHFRTRAI